MQNAKKIPILFWFLTTLFKFDGFTLFKIVSENRVCRLFPEMKLERKS